LSSKELLGLLLQIQIHRLLLGFRTPASVVWEETVVEVLEVVEVSFDEAWRAERAADICGKSERLCRRVLMGASKGAMRWGGSWWS